MREMQNEELRMKNGGWGKIGDCPQLYMGISVALNQNYRCGQLKLPLPSTEITWWLTEITVMENSYLITGSVLKRDELDDYSASIGMRTVGRPISRSSSFFCSQAVSMSPPDCFSASNSLR